MIFGLGNLHLGVWLGAEMAELHLARIKTEHGNVR